MKRRGFEFLLLAIALGALPAQLAGQTGCDKWEWPLVTGLTGTFALSGRALNVTDESGFNWTFTETITGSITLVHPPATAILLWLPVSAALLLRRVH